MIILKFLSEWIFDFSAEQMTQNKINSNLWQVFELCLEVLEQASKTSLIQPLIKATLETLL